MLLHVSRRHPQEAHMNRARLVVLAVCFAAAATATARGAAGAADATDDVRKFVEKQYPSLESFYATLHREPELSLAEEKTAKRLAEQFRSAGYEVTERVGGHGVVAI